MVPAMENNYKTWW